MACSYRHIPMLPVTNAASEKQDKRQANSLLRRKVKQGKVYLTLRDVSNVWAFGKDGKVFQRSASARDMRK